MSKTDPFNAGGDVHFVTQGDWRADLEDDDPDDEQIKTSPDVVAALGFDPAEDE